VALTEHGGRPARPELVAISGGPWRTRQDALIQLVLHHQQATVSPSSKRRPHRSTNAPSASAVNQQRREPIGVYGCGQPGPVWRTVPTAIGSSMGPASTPPRAGEVVVRALFRAHRCPGVDRLGSPLGLVPG